MERRRRRTALCLADLHSHVTALQRLDGLLGALAGQLDVVLVAGDVTVPGREAYARRLIDAVARHRVPLLLVHGNNDSWLAVQEFRRAGVTIHRREREVAGVRFTGFGGTGDAPHDLELGPDETLHLDPQGSILLTHVPPPGGLRYGPDTAMPASHHPDESRLSRAAPDTATPPPAPPGAPPPRPLVVHPSRSRKLRSLDFGGGPARFASQAPRAQVCGHIHHSEGVAWVGPTKVIKLRAAMWNRCALLDLDTLAVTFRDLAP
jgi:Icc-related predicted phosphoesterase